MKNLSYILNGVLLISVGILYYLHFSGTGQATRKDAAGKIIKDTARQVIPKGNLIAYIYSDSLLLKYKYSIELNDNITRRKDQYMSHLESKNKTLQNDFIKFQEKEQKGLFMCEQSKMTQYQELQQRDYELKSLYEKYLKEFNEMQEKMNVQLNDSVSEFLKKFNEEPGFQFILGKSNIFGVTMLYSDEYLNITDTVINLLNERYEKFKLPVKE